MLVDVIIRDKVVSLYVKSILFRGKFLCQFIQ